MVRRQRRSWGYPVWKWWGDLAKIGPDYVYFPNAKKTDLLVNVNYNYHMVAEATELLRTQVLMFVRRELGIWEQPLVRGGVSIHCMDWTGLLD